MDTDTVACATKTDRPGQARIRLLHPGLWVIKVTHEVSYGDETEYDVNATAGTLTFGR